MGIEYKKVESSPPGAPCFVNYMENNGRAGSFGPVVISRPKKEFSRQMVTRLAGIRSILQKRFRKPGGGEGDEKLTLTL